MDYPYEAALGFSSQRGGSFMDNLAWLKEAGGLFGLIITTIRDFVGLDPVAVLFALMTPLLILFARHEVRLRRLQSIKDFLRAFDPNAVRDPPQAVTPAAQLPQILPRPDMANTSRDARIATNPSFEFVKSKYISDLRITKADGETFDRLNDVEQIDWILRNVGGFGSYADRRLFYSSIGLVILVYFGFSALSATLLCGLGTTGCAPGASYGSWAQLAAIGSLAFAGAYIAAVRSFVRAVAVFDLSPYGFLRQTGEIVASVIFTIVLFALLRDPFAAVAAMLPGTAVANTDTHIQPVWYGLAPLLGLLPQSATKFLLVKFQSLITWIKISDDRFVEVSKITSLDVIDGIDYETRFRLEECGIYDVQNLATYNPIMLHIESPYGIYQTFDWVAQAQLCHILGLEKFLIFREMNIRTIFDLERAISSRQSVPAFDEICAGILFAPTSGLKKTLEIAVTGLIKVDAQQATKVGADDYCLWARLRIQGTDSAQAAEHVLRWIADDLHVRRLRRLWIDISNSLGESSWCLPDNPDAQIRIAPLQDQVAA